MPFSQSPAPTVGHASVNALLWRSDTILSLLGLSGCRGEGKCVYFPSITWFSEVLFFVLWSVTF